MTESTRRLLRPRNLVILGSLAIAALVVGALVFKPWLLWTDVRVDEELSRAATQAPIESSTPSATPSATPTPTGPVVLATGEFISHEHETTGTATIVERPDGSRVLEIANLDTSNGPDLRVWLSDSEVVPGSDGWFVAGGYPYVELGALKGNQGNQVYEIPQGTDLSTIRSVAIWCIQFSVSFGAAPILVS